MSSIQNIPNLAINLLNTKTCVILLFIAVNLIVARNCWVRNPKTIYDSGAHLRYYRVLALKKRLPKDRKESLGYFYPPAPYYLPALLMRALNNSGVDQELNEQITFRFAVFQCLIASAIALFFLIKLCLLILPGNYFSASIAILLLGMTSTYYKAFSMLRGEPLLLMFTVVAAYLFARVCSMRGLTKKQIYGWIGLSLSLALAVLSRHFGLVSIIAIACTTLIYAKHNSENHLLREKIVAPLATCILALCLSLWFFVGISDQGGLSAFNRQGTDWSDVLFSQGIGFYSLEKFPLVFSYPFRSSFSNQLFPQFYADYWGDIWGYFLVSRRKLPPVNFMNYLGTVNAIGLSVIGLFIFVIFKFIAKTFKSGLRATNPILVYNFLVFIGTFSMYYLYLLKFPNYGKGDTLKSIYPISGLPSLVVLTVYTINSMSDRWKQVIAIVIPAIFMFNIGTYFLLI